MNSKLGIKRLCIIGVGLIGGSLARALRRADVVEHIIGVGRSRKNLETALQLGVVDEITHDIGEGVRNADMVIVAVPMGMYENVFRAMAEHIQKHTIISDVGSTKSHALKVAKQYLTDASCFVPAHPIAGTEKSGAAASFAGLFDDHTCILTPEESTDPEAVQCVEQMWEAAGSHVMQMDAATHDDLLAAVSHLPHLAAFALVNAVNKQKSEVFDPFAFAAGGFRDFTRIASSSPEMWRDIALCNRQALMHQLAALQKELSRLGDVLRKNDGKILLDEFSAAKKARDQWLKENSTDL